MDIEQIKADLEQMTAVKDIHQTKRHEQFERAEAAEARIADLEAAVFAQDALIKELVGALEFIDNKVSWEINPSNYSHQEVCDMNSDWVVIGNAAMDALVKAKAAT